MENIQAVVTEEVEASVHVELGFLFYISFSKCIQIGFDLLRVEDLQVDHNVHVQSAQVLQRLRGNEIPWHQRNLLISSCAV
jgi:hypothetical protein